MAVRPFQPRGQVDARRAGARARLRMLMLASGAWLLGGALARRTKRVSHPARAPRRGSGGETQSPLGGIANGLGGHSDAPRGAHSGWLGDARSCAIGDLLLLALAGTTVAVCMAGPNGPLRLLLVLATACLVPGGALLTRLPAQDALTALGLAVGLGLCIETVGALAMIWTGVWHPVGAAGVLLTLTCAMLAADLLRIACLAKGWS
jgi:hypothetical protein